MLKNENWQKFFKAQDKSGWCGPAVIQMVLKAASIKKSQKSIANDVYQKWYGVTPQIMIVYLSRFFNSLGYKESAEKSDIIFHLKKKRLIIVDWWDDIDLDEKPDGHYSLILNFDKKQNKFTLADPSAGRGIWQMDAEEFRSKWYDYLDINKKIKLNGWLLWIDPASKFKNKHQFLKLIAF